MCNCEQGINLDNRHKEADALLSLVLSQLDEAKPRHPLDQEEDKKHCERFALNVFRKAQRKDEEGLIDKDVSKAYYAAFNFLEVSSNLISPQCTPVTSSLKHSCIFL